MCYQPLFLKDTDTVNMVLLHITITLFYHCSSLLHLNLFFVPNYLLSEKFGE